MKEARVVREHKALQRRIERGLLKELKEKQKKEIEEIEDIKEKKIYLNIRNLLKIIYNRLFKSRKSTGKRISEFNLKNFKEFFEIFLYIVSYGMIGCTIILILITLIPFHTSLSNLLRSSPLLEFLVYVFGAGSIFYLVYEFTQRNTE